jgi:hypothetical protein
VLLIIAFPDYKTNTDIAKKLNITSVLDKMQDYSRNLIEHVKAMLIKRVLKIIENLQTKRQKEAGKITDETTVFMRPKQVNK